jgi:hypothetical protein
VPACCCSGGAACLATSAAAARGHRSRCPARRPSHLPRAFPLRYFMTRTRSIQANPSQNGRIKCGNARSPMIRTFGRCLLRGTGGPPQLGVMPGVLGRTRACQPAAAASTQTHAHDLGDQMARAWAGWETQLWLVGWCRRLSDPISPHLALGPVVDVCIRDELCHLRSDVQPGVLLTLSIRSARSDRPLSAGPGGTCV